MAAEQRADPDILALRSTKTGLVLEDTPVWDGGPHLLCDVSTGRPRPVVPLSWRRRVFDSVHALSHPGVRASVKLVSARFVWPGLRKTVKEWAAVCIPCQRLKIHRHTQAPLEPFRIPDMTKPKTKPCPSCQAPNTCNRKTCSGCLGSLNVKEGLKKKQEQFKNINWAASVKKNRNASRVVNSAQLSVSKLHALGYQPILFLGQFDRKGRIVGDVITQIQPAEGAARDILMKMRKLYEHLLRKLQASPPAESSTPAAGPSSADSVDAGPVPDPEALNEEFILHLEPVPTSSLCQPPASSSLSLLPPASPSPSLLPPASSSPSLLPPASSSPSLLPPASSSPSLLPPASSSPSLLPPASSSPSLLPPASSSLSLLPPASSSPSLLPPASSSPSLLPPASSSLSLLPPASSSPSPHPASPSISTVYTSNLPIKKRTRKG
ncbi:unnamed protein product [Oreochromis niloticus]|nr:unnamed protein product [Mustela putorius furo]